MDAKFTAALLTAAGLGVGCAVNPQPSRELALAEIALAAARDAGAARHAPAELGLAEEKLALARRWIGARDYEPARWLVEQAKVDAELAALKAASAHAMREASRQAAEFRLAVHKTTFAAQ